MNDGVIHKETFNLAPHENGGEGLILHIEYYDNGDGNYEGIYTTQALTLHSYGNSATFNLCGASLTPEILRNLANTLEKGTITAFQKVNKF